jgi:glutathione S-transferase
MKLYYSPGACSLAAHIALHETGLPFHAVKVEGRGQKTAGGEEYIKVTPKNYVPALRLDDGEVLTEGTGGWVTSTPRCTRISARSSRRA